MSAPSATIRQACAIEWCGSMNFPPSEKESGVTLRMPMTSGRPSPSRRASGREGATFCAVDAVPCAVMAVALRRQGRKCQATLHSAIGDLEGKLIGVLDPTDHEFFGRQEAYQLALLVGLRHGLGEIGRIAVFQFPYRLHADRAQQTNIAFAHALDAHVIAG